MKTGFAAAQHYFETNITDACWKRDPHAWNLSQGLALLAKSLTELDERLRRVEKLVAAEGQLHRK